MSSIRNGISKVIIDKIFNISSGNKKFFKNSGISSKALTSKVLVTNFINPKNILKAKCELIVFEPLI